MKKKKMFEHCNTLWQKIVVALLVAAIVILLLGISWFIVQLLVKLIFWCFGLTYTYKLGTGIWVTLLLLGQVIGNNN